MEGLLEVQYKHEDERVVRSASYHGVSQDGIWLILGVRLIGDDKTGFLSQLNDGVQALVPYRDHISIYIEAAVVPEELKAENVRLALPHLLLHVNRLVDHRQLGHLIVAPHLEAPIWVGCQIVHAEGIDPKARRFSRADPDLVDDLRDVCSAAKVFHVPLTPRLPLGRVAHFALAPVPMVVGAYGAHLQFGVVLQNSGEVLILGIQLTNDRHMALCATQQGPTRPLMELGELGMVGLRGLRGGL
mmetsp:Transcript_41385/g.88185  ORF Transcript_41385/g.88185 Transcript_41385/m.88185 type:complete len:244 (+) Transcript_41385:1303-2034(+)